LPISDIDIICPEITGFARLREFNLSTRWLGYLYAHYLPKFESGRYWKMMVDLYPTEYSGQPFFKDSQLYYYRRQFDFEHYFSLDIPERKRLLLETLQNGLLKIAAEMGLPQQAFEQAYQRCLDCGLEARFAWSKPKFNRRRTMTAAIEWVVEVDRFSIYIKFCDKEGQEISKWEAVYQDISISPFFVKETLGGFHWISDDTVRLISRRGNKCWDIKIDGTVTEGMMPLPTVTS